MKRNEPPHGKTNNVVSEQVWHKPGCTNFEFRKKWNCRKIKVLISFAVTAKLICAFVFTYADCWFSHVEAQIFYEGYS